MITLNNHLKVNDSNASAASSATEKRIELHVYILPPNFWLKDKNLAYNETIKESISLGFIRASQDLLLRDLRKKIQEQCNKNEIPKSYAFLKSVGRAFAKVKPQQENELKVKHFLPFQEIFILEASSNKENQGLDQHIKELTQSRMYNHSNMQKSSPNQFSKSWESFDKETEKASEFERLMKEQERLRNRQAELERMRNKHSKSQFDHRTPVNNTKNVAKSQLNQRNSINNNNNNNINSNSHKNSNGKEENFHDEEESNENSEDYYQMYQSNSNQQINSNSTSTSRLNQMHNEPNKHHINIVDDFEDEDYYDNRMESEYNERPELRINEHKHLQNFDLTNGHGKNGQLKVTKFDNSKIYTVADLKEKLISTKKSRIEFEFLRDELIKHLKQIHNRITIRRKDARDIWKKKYFNEKKKTPMLEENVNALLVEIQSHQGKIVHGMEGDIKNMLNDGLKKEAEDKNNELVSYKLQEETYMLKRQVDQYKLKLTTDIKLRNQAETEIKALKTELFQTKMNINQLKSSF